MIKRLFSISVLMICAFIVFAQQPTLNQVDKNGKKQGKWVKKDKYERVLYEGNFKDGKPEGEFKYYYDNKDIKTISVFSKNGTFCRTKHYFPENVLMAEGNYLNEKRDSVWKFYNAPNALVSEESFKNGKKDGFEKNYNGKGKLVEERNWKDSVLNGTWKKYYENGEIQQEGNYLNGKLEGQMTFFYPEKIVAVSGSYVHSLKQGKWVQYHRSGKYITQSENYKNGTLDGAYAEWNDKNGGPLVRGFYKQGKRHDRWTYHDEIGKIKKDTTFFIGYLQGTCSEYYQDGKKKKETNYYYSKPIGTWTEWDESGKVVKEEKFDTIEQAKAKLTAEEKVRKNKNNE